MRVLVIGCGPIGRRHIANLKALGCEVVVHDTDAARAAAACAGLGVSVDTRIIPPDAVVICTPAETHAAIALGQIELGVPAVFVEKPLATTVEDCERICEAAEKARVVAMVGHQWRFHPAVREAKTLEGTGAIVTLASVATNGGAGVVLEYGSHAVDLARHLMGDVLSISDSHIHEHTLRASLKHANAVSHFCVNDSVGDVRLLSMLGTEYGARTRDLNDPVEIDEMYKAEMAHFLDCVRTGKTPEVTLHDGTEAVRWALACAQ